jgi:hypothetical protein
MARLSNNPDRDFSAGYQKKDELANWQAEPPLPLDDFFDDPVVLERIGQLIANSIRRSSN